MAIAPPASSPRPGPPGTNQHSHSRWTTQRGPLKSTSVSSIYLGYSMWLPGRRAWPSGRLLRTAQGPVPALPRVASVPGAGSGGEDDATAVTGDRSLFVSRGCLGARRGGTSGTAHSVGVGPGSDLSEEPAVQDVEPVTLDFAVVPGCPPGPAVSGWPGRRGAVAGRHR